MDKKSLIGIGVIVVLFAGFAYFSSKEQEKYQREMAAYRAVSYTHLTLPTKLEV